MLVSQLTFVFISTNSSSALVPPFLTPKIIASGNLFWLCPYETPRSRSILSIFGVSRCKKEKTKKKGSNNLRGLAVVIQWVLFWIVWTKLRSPAENSWPALPENRPLSDKTDEFSVSEVENRVQRCDKLFLSPSFFEPVIGNKFANF